MQICRPKGRLLGEFKSTVDQLATVNNRYRHSLLVKLVPVAFCVSVAQAQMAPDKLVSFNAFIQSVKHADAADFLARPGSKIKNAAAFEEMRQYVLSLYRDVHVKRTYLLGSQTFDCVPINEQPSVRALGPNKSVAEPPATNRSQPAGAKTSDQSTGTGHCEDQTIPMRRITLEQLSQFATLSDFLKKSPNAAPRAPE